MRTGVLDLEYRRGLIELTRDGSVAHRLARRANALLRRRLRGSGLCCTSGLINQSVVDKAIFMETPQSDRQGRLSLETVKLSEGFSEALRKRTIPLEESAIRALANNSAALDAYIWLAYRLHILSAPRMVTWQALKAQHGTAYRNLHHFKPRFLGILAMATAVYYPEAN